VPELERFHVALFNLRGMQGCIDMRVDDSRTGNVVYASPRFYDYTHVEDRKTKEALKQLLREWMVKR
jgi:hypothetical protein